VVCAVETRSAEESDSCRCSNVNRLSTQFANVGIVAESDESHCE